jgi:hypothetical protein
MHLHKRAQTANPAHKLKHQETILKEIKTAQEMEKIEIGHSHHRSDIPNPYASPFRM